MEKENIKEKVLRYQLLAEQYKNEDVGVFVKEINGTYYFAKVINVFETHINLFVYAPEKKANTYISLDWLNIINFTKDKGFLKKEEIDNEFKEGEK